MRQLGLSLALSGRGGNSVVVTATISGLTATNQDAAGDVALAYTIDRNSSVTGVVTTSATAPTAAQILAGQDHTGASASSTFTDSWTLTGASTLQSLTNGLSPGTYYVHVLPAGGDDADVASSNGFTMETVAPTIVSAQTSTDGLTVTVTFSEPVTGTASDLDWEVYSNGTPLGVDTVTPISSATTAVLTLVSAAVSGATITFDYTPGNLADAVSNPLAAISGQSVTNNVPVSGDPVEFAAVLEHTGGAADPQIYNTNLGLLGYAAGDLMLFSSGVQRQGITSGTGLTVNGSAATNIVDGGGTAGSRMSTWWYIVQAADISAGTISISVELATTEDDGLLLLLNAKALRVAGTTQNVDWRHGFDDAGGAINNTVTTSNASQVVATLVMGQGGNFSGGAGTAPPTFALGTVKTNQNGLDLGNDKGVAFALHQPGASGTQAQTVTGNGTNKLAATTVVLG